MVYEIYVDGSRVYDSMNINLQCLDMKLKMTMNEAGSFDFTIPPDSICYNSIEILKSTVDVKENGKIIWTGRPIQIEADIKKNKKVRCEGALAFFNDIVLNYKEYKSTNANPWTVGGFFRDIISRYNKLVPDSLPGRRFEVDSAFRGEEENIWRKTDFETVWEILEDMVLNAEGGYFLLRKASPGNNPITISYVEYFQAVNNTQKIEVGQNVVDISIGTTAENTVTDIYPVCHYNSKAYSLKNFDSDYSSYYNSHKPGSLSNGAVGFDNGVLYNKKLRNKYGRVEKVVEYDMVENLESTDTLQEKVNNNNATSDEKTELAKKTKENKATIEKTKIYMYTNAVKKAYDLEYATRSITVKAADLKNLQSASSVNIDNLRLGQLIKVTSVAHGIMDESLPIYEIDIDLTSGVKSMTVGFPAARELSKILAPNTSKKSWKKGSTKHTTTKEKAANAPSEYTGLIDFTETHGKYMIGESVNISDFKVGRFKTDGTYDDITSSCTFTIDGNAANGYTFSGTTSKSLVATTTISGEQKTCSTTLTVSVSLMYKIYVTENWTSTYHLGDTFNIARYKVMGRYRDDTRVVISNDNPNLTFSIANGTTITKNTPRTLWVYYEAPETEDRLSASAEIVIVDDQGKVIDDKGPGDGEADENGYHLVFETSYNGYWSVGQTVQKSEYTVGLYNNGQFVRMVSAQCTYNIGVGQDELYAGSPSDFSYNGLGNHVINGYEPSYLSARYKVSQNSSEIWVTTPFRVAGAGSGSGGHGPGEATEEGYWVAFTRVHEGFYVVGDQFSLADYEVSLYNDDLFVRVVTDQCTWNIRGTDPTVVGGVVTDPGSDDPNDHIMNGFEPKTLKATYTIDGKDIWCEVPLIVKNPQTETFSRDDINITVTSDFPVKVIFHYNTEESVYIQATVVSEYEQTVTYSIVNNYDGYNSSGSLTLSKSSVVYNTLLYYNSFSQIARPVATRPNDWGWPECTEFGCLSMYFSD